MLLIQISLLNGAWGLARQGEWPLLLPDAFVVSGAWLSVSIWGEPLFLMLAIMLQLRIKAPASSDALTSANLVEIPR